MSLKLRTTLIFVLILSIMLSVFGAISYHYLTVTFIKLELEQMEKNLSRISNALEKEKKSLNLINEDWAIWSDTYNFMKSKSKNYIESNIDDETLRNLEVNFMTFFKPDSKVLYTTSLYQGRKLKNLAELNKVVAEIALSTLYKGERKATAGFFNINEKVFLVSVAPVLKSTKKGNHNGFLVFAKIINEKFLESLSAQLLLPLVLVENKNSKKEIHFHNDMIHGIFPIKDIFGTSLLEISLSSKTSYLEAGTILLIKLSVAMTITIIILLKALHILIERNVVNRVIKLQESVSKIALHDIKADKIEMTGNDEVSRLSDQINKLLDHFYGKETQLLHASKLATVGTMAASFAHEINNPVFAVKGSLELIELKINKLPDDDYSQGLKKSLSSAQIGLERLTHIVGSLTTFVRANDGDKSYIDAHENISKCYVLLKHIFKKHDIEFRTDFRANECHIFANSGQFQQVITNLLANAKDATKNVDSPCVSIRTKNEDQNIIIEVEDNGHGIEDTSKIFETFYTTKPGGQGTGLGLDIVNRIVENIDGRISVDSTVGIGTTFTVTIPFSEQGALEC